MNISYLDIINLNITGTLPQFKNYKNDQYKYFLKFINDILKYSKLDQITSIYEFKNIKKNNLINNYFKLDNLVAKYQDKFMELFNIDIEYGKINGNNNFSNKNALDYLLDIMNLIVRCYNYKLITWLNNENELFLSIKKK